MKPYFLQISRVNKNTLTRLILVSFVFLSACWQPLDATNVPAVATVTATLDSCSAQNMQETIKLINNPMRVFDDYAVLGSNTPQAKLVQVIAPMQEIRRTLEDVSVPACLIDLKKISLIYTGFAIQTLIAFQSNLSADILNEGVQKSRQAHNAYFLEVARLLGLTITPPPTANPTVVSALPSATLQAEAIAETPTPAVPFSVVATVTNTGLSPLNLRSAASLTSEVVGVLEPGQSASVLGKNSNGEWILIELPGQPAQKAWVYSTLVSFSAGDPASLPVVATPIP